MRVQPLYAFMGLLLAALIVLPVPLLAADWSRFRGPAGAGIAADSGFPAEVNPETNLRWKVPSGKGTSSPVVVGSRIFLTAFDGDDRIVTCFDAKDGKVAWTKSIPAQRKEVATGPGGPANPTPAADESNVYVFFPDLGLSCFSHDGQQRWRVPLGPFHSFHGVTASLVLAENNVIVLVDQLQESFLAALDCRNGAEKWKVARQDGPIGGYSTPATRLTAGGKTELIVSGPMEVVGYDAASGERRWSIDGVTNAPISIPVVAGNQIFVCEPSFSANPFKIDSLLVHDKDKDGELSLEELASQVPLQRIARRIDQGWGNGDGKVSADELEKAFKSFVGGGGLVAIELDESKGPATARVSWTYRRSVPQIPSLLYNSGTLFFVNDGGILTSVDPTTGNILKRARLNHGATFYASPVAAGGRILLIDTEGKMSVVTAEAEWSVLSTTQLGQRCYATPAVANGSVYIRGENDLFCFRDSP
jgi:outer membrane protein assembly factor BamB